MKPQDDLELLCLTEGNRENSRVDGSGRRIQKINLINQSCDGREHLCQILFEFYHGQTFHDEVKNLTAANICQYYKSFVDNNRDWKGHPSD